MRSDTRIVAVVAAAGAIALAGCGTSSGSSGGAATKPSAATPTSGSASPTGKKIDVCKIVTPADAQTVVGGPVVEQAPQGGEGLASGVCIYKATGGGIRVSLLQVRVYPGPQFYGERALDHTKPIEISGADKAFVRTASGGRSVDVQFVKDGKTGTINYTDTGSTAAPATTATAVEGVATKLADAI